MRPEPVDWPTSRAILIGVSTYHDQRFLDIPAAANSVGQLRAVLTDPQLCGWPADRITVLADPSDSRVVATRIRRLAQETSGVLLLYYVGHGTLTAGGELCLTLTDTDAEAPDLTGVEYDRVRSAFRDSPAQVKAAILDCCYSGRAIESLADQAAVVADHTDIRGAYTLTASDLAAHVPPLEKQEISCTSFTGELVDLIRTGIPGQSGSLTLGTLYLELRRRLRTRGLPAPNQRGTDTAHSFAFTRNAADIAHYSEPRKPTVQDSDRPTRRPSYAKPTPLLRPSRRGKALLALGSLIAVASTVVFFVLNTENQGSGRPYSSARPGCDKSEVDAQWTTIGAEVVGCGEDGSRLVKLIASSGDIAKGNAELRFTPAGQPFPSDYKVTVKISGLTDPDPVSEGACAGFATHTNADGTTFEELVVCSDQYSHGKVSLIKVSNSREIYRDEKKPFRGTGSYRLSADVSPTEVTFTADNHQGSVVTLKTSAVSSTTSYVGLTIFYMSRGATATFSDFRYQPGVHS